nr:hypothetical protein [Rhizobium sp. ACO-34A]
MSVTIDDFVNSMPYKAGLDLTCGERRAHSPEDLKRLFDAISRVALSPEVYREVMYRALTIAERRIANCMMPRNDLEWGDSREPLYGNPALGHRLFPQLVSRSSLSTAVTTG